MKTLSAMNALAIILIAGVLLLGFAAPVFADEEHDGEKLEHVVPLEGKSGVNLLLARWYNENRLLYALAVTVAMAAFGFLIGRATEWALRLLGFK
jgi:hypothetical protein